MATDRRALIADAAIATLAAEGMRGLTHRAVDRTAGLAEGSTSYYFRTREALIFAALARMAELDTADIGELPDPGGVPLEELLTELLTGLLRRWLTDGRTRTLARYELTLEATRRPRLRERLVEHGSGFLAMAVRLLTSAGIDSPRRRAHELIAFIDGVLYHQLVGVGDGAFDEDDLRAVCRDMLATALRRA